MQVREQTALAIIVDSLRQHKMLLIICWSLIIVISIAYALIARPVYRAELVLAPVESESGNSLMSSLSGQLGQFASIAGLNVGGDTNIHMHLALLESKEFTKEFIQDNDILPILYEEEWDAEKGDWKDGHEKTMWQVLENFDRNVRSVSYDSTSGIVRLRIDWYSGRLASQWANEMGDRLNRVIRQRAITEANESVHYLQEELAKNSIVGVEQSIYRLIESQISKIMLANVRKDYAFQVIDPAIPPSDDAQLRPNRPLILAIGFVLGFVVGGFASVAAGALRDA